MSTIIEECQQTHDDGGGDGLWICLLQCGKERACLGSLHVHFIGRGPICRLFVHRLGSSSASSNFVRIHCDRCDHSRLLPPSPPNPHPYPTLPYPTLPLPVPNYHHPPPSTTTPPSTEFLTTPPTNLPKGSEGQSPGVFLSLYTYRVPRCLQRLGTAPVSCLTDFQTRAAFPGRLSQLRKEQTI